MGRDVLSMITKKAVSSKSPSPTATKVKQALLLKSTSVSNSKTHRTTIVGEYLIKIQPLKSPESAHSKLHAFDLDGTLIRTRSGGTFSKGPTDWTWLNDNVLPTLQSLNTPIVVFTNQGAVIANKTSKSFANFTKKCELIIAAMEKEGIDVSNVWIYASPKKGSKYHGTEHAQFDRMRKPECGMFEYMVQNDLGKDIVKDDCIYVGDAAGRQGDFSDSDKKFAQNVDIPFKTPEEFFA